MPHKTRNTVEIPVSGTEHSLPGELIVPHRAKGLVIFAHGSGSSRLSPRNVRVAELLNEAGLATLLFDLLGDEESVDRRNVFDIPLLADRLILATHWSQRQGLKLPVGYFGASTGAAAALEAAACLGTHQVAAVVSRGGRPDLAGRSLEFVECPTLLLVGSNDTDVLDMNRNILPFLAAGDLIEIQGAIHLFEESGALEMVAEHAARWFNRFLKGRSDVAA